MHSAHERFLISQRKLAHAGLGLLLPESRVSSAGSVWTQSQAYLGCTHLSRRRGGQLLFSVVVKFEESPPGAARDGKTADRVRRHAVRLLPCGLSSSLRWAATSGLLPQACQNTGLAPAGPAVGFLWVTSVLPSDRVISHADPLGTLETCLQA